MGVNLRTDLLNASRIHYEAHIEKHRVNVENLLNNSIGIGEHADIMDTIEKELEEIAKYHDLLEVLDASECPPTFGVSHEMVITEMSEDEKKHLITWKGDEWTNPDGTPTQAYLDYWTCELCGKHTHEVDYDYLGNGTNHLGCELKKEMEDEEEDTPNPFGDDDYATPSGTTDFIPAENNGEVKHFADGFHDGEWERD